MKRMKNLSSYLAEKLFEVGSSEISTPCFLIDPEIIKMRMNTISSVTPTNRIYYSMKANPDPLVLRQLCSFGVGVDVSSEVELEIALAIGFPARSISCVGPWKSPQFLSKCLKAGIDKICVEGIDEFNKIRELQSTDKATTKLFFRWQPSKDLGLEISESMIAKDVQFGLTTGEVRQICIENDFVFDGVHLYTGSDLQTVDDITSSLLLLDELPKEFFKPCIQFGPGIGVSYDLSVPDLEWTMVVERIYQLLSEYEVAFEIGRYLVAHSTALVSQVVVKKERHGQILCTLDTGMNSFARTVITDSVHPLVNLDQDNFVACNENRMLFFGPSCTPIDKFSVRPLFTNIEVGDKVAILLAGAYGSNLNFDGFIGFRKAETRTL